MGERKEGGKEEREEKRKACCGYLSASSTLPCYK